MGNWGETALVFATMNRQHDTMRLLLERGTDVNAGGQYYCDLELHINHAAAWSRYRYYLHHCIWPLGPATERLCDFFCATAQTSVIPLAICTHIAARGMQDCNLLNTGLYIFTPYRTTTTEHLVGTILLVALTMIVGSSRAATFQKKLRRY